MTGTIYLIPTVLGETSATTVIPAEVIEITERIEVFMVENLRTARRWLKKLNKARNIDALTFFELNKDTKAEEIQEFLAPVLEGKDAGIISEAGCPGIADPGSDVVKIAHQKNIPVRPLVGPSSILLALISSGLNGQNFAFSGYLPVKEPDRGKKIKILEGRSAIENQSQIFMETPYRNQKLLDEILSLCNKNTRLCIAADITCETEFIRTKTIGEWKQQIPDINKRPAIFILLAS
jgi:16S rRNA (cytidine1402-2'-O)-methyltransferase